ncbi:B12-binding domain-containing radical SAM protein [bacterium]|nr:B12-binding domain-containing radical SAM protein [bacterium]
MINKKRILLIHPYFAEKRHYGSMSKVAPSLLPVSLVYLAGYMEKQGYPVRIFDGQVENMTEKTINRVVNEFRPDVVGITCMTPMVTETHQVAEVVKERSNPPMVVVGGIHPSILPNDIVSDKNIDVIVRGEGEITLHELLEAWPDGDLDSIKGLSFRRDDETVHTPDRPLLDDLDSLPLPARHLVNYEGYHQVPDAVFAEPLREILTSRGCPFQCIFCSARFISGYKYRYHSPERVLEEVDLLVNKYGARQIAVLDDNFVVNRQRTIDICEGLIRGGYHKKVVWTAAARADQVDYELMVLMKKAGFQLLSFGIETGSPRLLKTIKKGENMDQIAKAIEDTHRAKIKSRGTLILGLPTETREESLATIQWAKDLRLDFAKFSLATPYPGTVLYDIAVKQGMKVDDWSHFSSMAGFADYDPVFVPEGRDPLEMAKLQKQAMREFYLRPRQILNLMRNITSWNDIKMYYYGAKSVLLKR